MAWELDNYWEEDSFTDAEVDAYLTNFVPTLKASLAASNVGDVPLFGKAQSPNDNHRGGYPMGEHADIAGMVYYFSVSGSSWASVVQTRFNQFYNDYCPATGHSGQAYWSTEMGIQSGDLQEEWTPSLLTQILNGMGGEFALGMFWNMWNPTTSGQGTWSAFDPSGNMKDWFNGLLPVITPLI